MAGEPMTQHPRPAPAIKLDRPRLQSALNRWLDRWGLLGKPGLRDLHRQLRSIMRASHADWASADYGAGYLYQSCPALGLRGFRQTDQRVRAMDIAGDLQGKTVLEVGCNSGFLSLALAPGTQRFVAFDNNPFLIQMAQVAAQALPPCPAEFFVEAFETWPEDDHYEVALSFANHSTWDGNMTLPLDGYFAKLQRLLVPGGLLIFESHHPALENARQLEATLNVMAQRFEILTCRPLQQGSAWDRGRTLVKAVAKAPG